MKYLILIFALCLTGCHDDDGDKITLFDPVELHHQQPPEANAVPEPTTIALLAVGTLAMMRKRVL